MDGLVEQVWRHRDRCLSYGDGVAFWALAEMVRQRAATKFENGRAITARLIIRRFKDLSPAG